MDIYIYIYILVFTVSTCKYYSTVVGSGWFQCIVVYIFAIVWYYLGCVPVYNSRSHFYHNLRVKLDVFFFEAGKCTKRHFLNGRKFRHFVRKFAFLGRTVASNTWKTPRHVNRAGLQVLRGDPWFEHGRGRCRYQRHGGRRLVASPRKWTGSTGEGCC